MGTVGAAVGSLGSGNATKNVIKDSVYREFGFKDANDGKLLNEAGTADAKRLAEISKEVGGSSVSVGFETKNGELHSYIVNNGKIFFNGKDVTSAENWDALNANPQAMQILRNKVTDSINAKQVWDNRINTLSSNIQSAVYSKLPSGATNPKLVSMYNSGGYWKATVQYTATRSDGSTYVTDRDVVVQNNVWY